MQNFTNTSHRQAYKPSGSISLSDNQNWKTLQQHILYTPLFIRLNCSTAYVDAAYYYRPSSLVCQSVRRSVCLSPHSP